MRASKDEQKKQDEWRQLYSDLCIRLRGYFFAEEVWKWLNDAQKDLLGGNLENAYRKSGLIGMWHRAYSELSREQAVLDLADHLKLLDARDYKMWSSYLAGNDGLGASAVKTAIAQRGLVLINRSDPAAFWDAKRIPVDWVKHPSWWSFLWELAVVARTEQWLDERRFDDSTSWKAVTNRKSKLTNHDGFPTTLEDRIQSRTGKQHGYRLALTVDRIHLFHVVDGALREMTRRR